MIIAMIFFLAVSLLAYVVLGGADYGAGILEIFKGRDLHTEQEELVTHAIGPVWEANHIWLIIMVVILFMGFPEAYALLSIHLNIPLVAVLLGIVFRGCTFTFRHYDAIQSETSQRWYTRVFAASSVWTPVWLGVTAGALSLGHIRPGSTDYFESFIAPWWSPFTFAVGTFTASLFAFLAAAYLIGESENPQLRRKFIRRAIAANICTVITGAAVFATAEYEGLPLLRSLVLHPLGLASMLLATFTLWPLWQCLLTARVALSRLLAGAQASFVLFGWFSIQFPDIVTFVPGSTPAALDFYAAAAPPATQRQLIIALIVGLLLVIPCLFFLLRVFKLRPKASE